jgi:hypothetical protein
MHWEHDFAADYVVELTFNDPLTEEPLLNKYKTIGYFFANVFRTLRGKKIEVKLNRLTFINPSIRSSHCLC